MSVSSVLAAHVAPELPPILVKAVRPCAGFPLFETTYTTPWPQSTLFYYGERCRRALFVNDYHVLLCKHRIFLVDKCRKPVTLTPFDGVVCDALVAPASPSGERLVVVGLSSGLHVSQLRESSKDATLEVVWSKFLSTAVPVAAVHQVNICTFVFCLETCDVGVLACSLEDLSSGPKLDVKYLSENSTSWFFRATLGLATTRSYRDSFYNASTEQLVVLTHKGAKVWKLSERASIPVHCSVSLSSDAVALLPPHPGEGGACTVVLKTGSRVSLSLQCVDTDTSHLTEKYAIVCNATEELPDSLGPVQVRFACQGASTIVFYDELSHSLVVIRRTNHLTDGANCVPMEVVSLISLGDVVCGIAFEPSPMEGSDSGSFWVYGEDSVLRTMTCHSIGYVVKEHYALGQQSLAKTLGSVNPVHRSELLLSAACSGLSASDLLPLLSSDLVPVIVDRCRVRLSPVAVGFTHTLMQGVVQMDRHCAVSRHWRASQDLIDCRKRLLRYLDVAQEILHVGGWLERPAVSRWKWEGFEATVLLSGEFDRVTQTMANSAQSEYFTALLAAARHACTICWLCSLLLGADPLYRIPSTIRASVLGENPKHIEAELTFQLLSLFQRSITSQLLSEGDILPCRAQIAVRVHSLLLDDQFDNALTFVRDHIREIVAEDLLQYLVDLLESRVSHLQPELRMLLWYACDDRSITPTLLSKLSSIPVDSDKLRQALLCVFGDPDFFFFYRDVVSWMGEHDFGDPRVGIFASVVAEMRVAVNPAQSLTSRYLSAWSMEARGEYTAAARIFGEIARTSLRAPLRARLLCLEEVMRHDASDADKLAHFILLLQQQLVHLLQRHREQDGVSSPPVAVIDADLDTLTNHFLGEKGLFGAAARYQALGGGSIQLDILKIYPTSPERVVGDTLQSLLIFLKATGEPPLDVAQRVLSEYLPSFQGSLPLQSFVEFLAFYLVDVASIVQLFFRGGVPPISIFDTLLSFLGARDRTHFCVGETIEALAEVVMAVDEGKDQQFCAMHLLERIRGLLQGEFRSVHLSATDVEVLKVTDNELRKVARRFHH